MTKAYKIDDSKIWQYTKRNNTRSLYILVFALVFVIVLMFPMTQQAGATPNFIYMLLFSILFTTVLMGIIYFNNKSLTKISAENLQIIIDDTSITRIVNLENDQRLNFHHKMVYQKAKDISTTYYSKVYFDNITSIEKKNGDLWVRAVGSNKINGKNIVLVPRELANLDELEREIRNRLK